ncbi:MAG: peptidoglycan DD-metalloendopeptidase family protein [Bacteroidia bacterium]|nr:peptidoglycan DD-metalloendopeptidase family protein [Bacteroidia bacterium]MBP7261638.1 peptidoglycan DD-metalloendopeptidase family protein [Bacteroidia bacterium]MBP9181036.1 peptidoglycan DD-metalloendopeptidase family protein [Bacteroidia bacterium]MBP9724760.1 peptidoglycan DD-metalloendopeptidase family protein [Bacteroidia bacterium]
MTKFRSAFPLRISRLSSLLLLLLCVALCNTTQAQSRSELERKRKQQEQEIKLTRKMLLETKKKEKATLNQLEILNTQIKTRSQLIQTINQEIDVVDTRITELNSTINTLQREIEQMRKQYAQLVVASYKNRNTLDKLMYILASDGFEQAYKRMKYVQQFSVFRQKQVSLILKTQTILLGSLNELRNVKDEKEVLLGDKETEKKELEQDKQEEARVLIALKQKEKELVAQLRKKEEAARKLKKAIEDLIAKEIEAARKREELERKKREAATGKKEEKTSTAKATELALTPEAANLANEFSRNKGTLPWPVEQGFISKAFGTHPHPTLKNITVNNTGIDITTQKNAKARAVFRGEVKMKFSVPGMGNAVIVSHGDYYTVYTNLEDVFVRVGDKISTKQEIGTVMSNEVEEKTELHIEIYKGKMRLDPQEWLFKK